MSTPINPPHRDEQNIRAGDQHPDPETFVVQNEQNLPADEQHPDEQHPDEQSFAAQREQFAASEKVTEPPAQVVPAHPTELENPARHGEFVSPQVVHDQPVQVVEEQPTQVVYGQPAEVVPARSYGAAVDELGVDRGSVIEREKEQFGGVKVGSAFFGWVAAAGIAVILTSLLTAAGVVLSLTSNTSTADIAEQAAAGTGAAKTVGLVGGILLLVVLFVAYYCGGYVAGRMARFNGVKQGLAVWIWGLLFAVIIFVLVKVAGSQYNILSNLNLPRIPVDEGSVTTASIIAIAAIVVVTLGAALLGGLAGMRFHRNVDKAGLAV